MASAAQIKVTLVKSLYGQLKHISSSVRGLGLRRPHQSVKVAAARYLGGEAPLMGREAEATYDSVTPGCDRCG